MKTVPKGCTSTYLVQFNLLLLGEVAVAVFEVFQNHFLPRSIAEKGVTAACASFYRQSPANGAPGRQRWYLPFTMNISQKSACGPIVQ